MCSQKAEEQRERGIEGETERDRELAVDSENIYGSHKKTQNMSMHVLKRLW